MKCLVVDDSRVVRKVAQRITKDMGFTCSEAKDGQEAYAFCQNDMPDAIILDWNMPIMSGIEFLEKLRALEYIMKPFDSEIIASKFEQLGLHI